MVDALINLYRQAEDYFFRGISLKCLNINEVSTAYMTGVPVADLNLVYIKKNTDTLENILKQSKQFYDQSNLDFILIIPEEFCMPEVENILSARAYYQTGTSISMAISLQDFKANHASSFDDETTIRANDDQLNDWLAPLTAYPGTDLKICIQYADTHIFSKRNQLKIYHFSLYKQKKPVASITLSLHDNLARIDDVGTLPEFQGKGYATRLITYVLSQAKKLGANYCFLEASDSGLSIYQKLGFETIFKNKIYSGEVVKAKQ